MARRPELVPDGCAPIQADLAIDTELDTVVEALCAEIVANSAGTNRIVKALLADAAERTRSDGLHHERSLPHGRPEDMADRMRAGGR